jgi:hypothetical protein
MTERAQIFKQTEFEDLFAEQVERLKAARPETRTSTSGA